MPVQGMAEPSRRQQAERASDAVRAFFHVTGPADPVLLPRLMEPAAKLGYVPARVHATSEAGDGSELSVDLRLRNVPPRAAQLIEHALRSMIGVRQVISVIEPE